MVAATQVVPVHARLVALLIALRGTAFAKEGLHVALFAPPKTRFAVLESVHGTGFEGEGQMYQYLATHEIMPGKTPDLIKWLQGNYDQMRKKDPKLKVPGDPDYRGPQRQYITMFGSAYQFVMQYDVEKLPGEGEPYALATHNQALLPLIVPGRTVVQLLKQLEFQ
jgi:hypothetical protein